MNSDTQSDSMKKRTRKSGKLQVYEMTVFAMLGAIMFVSKMLMEALPNIHTIGMLTMLYTVVYRRKALIPLYIYVLLNGLVGGFSLWWIPYLYIWTILWAVTMALPRNMSDKAKAIVYPVVCALHGLAYGTLYAPAQALLFHLDFKGMLSWIAAGFTFDMIHAAGNFALGLMIVPLSKVLRKLDNYGEKITG